MPIGAREMPGGAIPVPCPPYYADPAAKVHIPKKASFSRVKSYQPTFSEDLRAPR